MEDLSQEEIIELVMPTPLFWEDSRILHIANYQVLLEAMAITPMVMEALYWVEKVM